jgi:hypothetical protein
MRRIKRDKPANKIIRGLEAAIAGDYTVREIKRDKLNPTPGALASRASGVTRTGGEQSLGGESPTPVARPEAQIIRLVPKIRAHSPWEVYFGALREYQNQWLRLWASFLPR